MTEQGVTITDIDIPFGRIVGIVLKWMVASIPAILIFYAIAFILMLIFGGMFAGCAALFSGLGH